jgi:hypothetical protein
VWTPSLHFVCNEPRSGMRCGFARRSPASRRSPRSGPDGSRRSGGWLILRRDRIIDHRGVQHPPTLSGQHAGLETTASTASKIPRSAGFDWRSEQILRACNPTESDNGPSDSGGSQTCTSGIPSSNGVIGAVDARA